MAAIAKDKALKIAENHVANVPINHPDYRLGFELCGRIGNDWLFEYQIHCVKNISEEEQESFAGAGGFLVSAQGEVCDLSVPTLIEAKHNIDAG